MTPTPAPTVVNHLGLTGHLRLNGCRALTGHRTFGRVFTLGFDRCGFRGLGLPGFLLEAPDIAGRLSGGRMMAPTSATTPMSPGSSGFGLCRLFGSQNSLLCPLIASWLRWSAFALLSLAWLGCPTGDGRRQ
jgi:hypothetical protein